MRSAPSFADVPASTPINKSWSDASARERQWFLLQMGALAALLAAIVFWPRTTPNVTVQAALCVLVGYASVRHSRSSRLRARLSPLPDPTPPSSR